MKNSVKRLLLLAVSVIALALVVAPVTFAGEDDPGPTQAGEIQAPQDGNTLAGQQGPAEESSPAVNGDSNGNSNRNSNGNSSKSVSSTQVLGATESFSTSTTRTKDVVKAKGGIQAGFGGMASQPTSSTTLAGLVGVLFALAAAVVLIPFRLRSQD
jgi:hypothetical protein